MKKAILIVLLLAAAGGAVWWFFIRQSEPAVKFRLGKVERGDLRVVVGATGTVQPYLLVQVGTQVTGTIQKLLVDFNSRVTEKELGRSKELQKKELISPSDLDAAVATYESLAAGVKVAEASVAQAAAALESSMVNLRYTTIISPIDGVVISRNVDVGQTVAASLSAPTIYVIADDMKKVQIQASVAEADIGRIKDEMDVTFTVDAHRTDRFKGKVSQIRLSPTTVQNVVTYTVMIDAANPGGKLLPGMTANVSFEIAQYKDILKIPNAALRFTPPAEHAPAPTAAAPATAPAPAGAPGGSGKPRGERKSQQQSRVWLNGPAGLVSLQVTADATDGTWTRMTQGDLTEGQEVVIGMILEGADPAMTTNPFAPSRGGGPGGGGQRGMR
ncbi:MAG: efflux RND transporter periplasmic adaptor subunit [Planctomycetes bacterium]|nr:efflux RND transporter periplasmic adaptor subunit [Planctomycetota bacterium]